jgi:hypothetical protein
MEIYRVVFVVLFLFSSNAYSQQVSYLKKGDVAKFDGTLISQEILLEYETNKLNDTTKEECNLLLESKTEIIKLKNDFSLQVKDIEIESMRSEFVARNKLKQENIDFLEKQVLLNPPSLLERWKYELGVFTGTAITIAIVAILNQVGPK